MAPLRFAAAMRTAVAFDGGLAVVSEFTGHRALYTTRPLPVAQQMRLAAPLLAAAAHRAGYVQAETEMGQTVLSLIFAELYHLILFVNDLNRKGQTL